MNVHLLKGFDDEEYPITWAIQTGDPVIRFVAANSMQDEMQETLLLGLVFCMFTIWWDLEIIFH